MRKKAGFFLILLGVLCIAAALVYLLFLHIEDLDAKRKSAGALTDIIHHIENSNNSPVDSESDNSSNSNYGILNPYNLKMKELVLPSGTFIGYLTISSLGLDLPVFSDWDYYKMTIAPCCYSGSVKASNLVIAGHNYSSHFGNLKNLSINDEIDFTDADNIRYRYAVKNIEVISPTDVELVTNGEFDLSLFTCTYGGENRVLVRCNKI